MVPAVLRFARNIIIVITAALTSILIFFEVLILRLETPSKRKRSYEDKGSYSMSNVVENHDFNQPASGQGSW